MQNEIERKFLVNPKLLDIESQNIIDIHYHNHAYLQSSQSYQVRVELHKTKFNPEEIGRINSKTMINVLSGLYALDKLQNIEKLINTTDSDLVLKTDFSFKEF